MASSGSLQSTDVTLTSGELRTLYLDLLRRPPLDLERKSFLADVTHLKTACNTPGAITPAPLPGPVDLAGKSKSLAAATGFWQQWFEEQLYYFLLVDNFAPRGESMLTIPAELAAGKLHVRDALHQIALSSSFDQRNPGADTFVTVVMEQIAGLAVDKNRRELEIGKAAYDGKAGNFLGRATSSQSDIVRSAFEQRSFALAFLAREHKRYVHAAPDKQLLSQWADAFQANPTVFPELLQGWIASPAYKARLAKREPMDNRLFVRSLIVDLCQREPTLEEFSRMRSALDGLADPQPLRSVMARLLLDSDQTSVPTTASGSAAETLVTEQFARFLGREPSAAERSAFVAGLAEEAGKPAVLVYALITSPEYQSY
ncbi:MAG TPA: hypothetical protein VM509_09785 [Planctomycetota bacterium]|nr:hypothetical protein [Planctomycetota bacterium]